MKNLKKITAIFIAVLFFLFSFNSSAESIKSIDETPVLDDLKSATIGGKPFDIKGYVFNDKKKLQVVAIVEYGYTYYKKDMDHYGIYLYLYNPGKLAIQDKDNRNKVQLATKYNSEEKPNSYEKFSLKFINKSEEAGYEGMFYKYKIVDNKDTIKNMARDFQSKSSYRRYDLSGFELSIYNPKNGSTAPIEYDLSTTCKFTGFAKGCDIDTTKESTLDCKIDALETIQLDVKSTYYRTDSSSLGKDHQNQLTSVYFSIDNDILEEYGNLQKIKAEWDEQKTTPIIVTSDGELGYALRKYLDKDIGEHTDDLIYTLGYNRNTASFESSSHISYSWSYNIETGKFGSWLAPTYIDSSNKCSTIDYVFFCNDATKDSISAEQLKDWIQTYNWFEHFFEDEVDERRTKGYNCVEIDAGDTFDLMSYTSNHSWWDKLLDYGLWANITGKVPKENSVYAVEPIHKVEDTEIVGTASSISKELLINENDVNYFKSYVTQAKANNQTTYLFRFATTDYFSGMLSIEKDGKTYGNNTTYMAQETVFLDFDIIELTFHKNGKYTVIPVVSNPIDIIGDITAPVEYEGWEWLEQLKRILKIILVVVLVVILALVLSPILPYIISFVVWIITLPFKLIKSIIKLFKKKKE